MGTDNTQLKETKEEVEAPEVRVIKAQKQGDKCVYFFKKMRAFENTGQWKDGSD